MSAPPATPAVKPKPDIAPILLVKRSYRTPAQTSSSVLTFPVPSDIPRVIFQTWVTANLPTGMAAAVATLKRSNPGFEHRFYSDTDAREFIRDYFPAEVLHAYDSLAPGAYRADLWRYCILYLRGGIYLDIKFVPVDGFSFETILDREHFCSDRDIIWMEGRPAIYNAFMITRPGNRALSECIEAICSHVRRKSYGKTYLDPTGPLLLGRYISKSDCTCSYTNPGEKNATITMAGKRILTEYKGYREEQRAIFQALNTEYYVQLWQKKKVYKNLAPDVLVQTFHLIPNSNFTTPINFNSCMCRTSNGSLRAFYRACKQDIFTWFNNTTHTCEVDPATMVPRKETIKELPLVSEYGRIQKLANLPLRKDQKCAEDTRAVFWNDHYYLTYTDGRVTYVGKCTANGDLVYSHWLDKPKGLTNEGWQEKNWIPFVHKNQLCILYSANPTVVFECTDTGTEITIARVVRVDQPPITCDYGRIRGGSTPVAYNEDQLLWFFHTVHEGWYLTGAMLTDNAHQIIAISRLPVAAGEPILFPCGAFAHGDGWRVTVGIADRHIGYFDVPRWLLEKYWVRV